MFDLNGSAPGAASRSRWLLGFFATCHAAFGIAPPATATDASSSPPVRRVATAPARTAIAAGRSPAGTAIGQAGTDPAVPLTIRLMVGLEGQLSGPQAVAMDGSGNVFIADSNHHTIRKANPSGDVSTLAGLAGSCGSADGVGADARFCNPSGIAVDGAGNVYVADWSYHTIRKVSTDGVVSTFAGLAGACDSIDGTGSAGRFCGPSGIAIDGAGNLYVADSASHTIRKVTSAGVVSTLAGLAWSPGSDDGPGPDARFHFPEAVAVADSGDVYVTDTYNHTIRKVSAAGFVSTVAGLAGTAGSDDGSGSAARFNYPMGIGVDSSGGVFVSDTMNHTIRKMAPSGAVATVAGLPGTFGNADGTGPDARFYQPIGLALDRFGTITIADAANHFIRRSVATAGATAFHPAPPCRLFDTRDTIGPATAAPALAPGETRLFAIEGRCSIPASAGSLSVNQTVTAPAASGELVLFRGDFLSPPIASSITFQAGKTRANNGILELSRDANGTFKVFNNSNGTVHFILDVSGYFQLQ